MLGVWWTKKPHAYFGSLSLPFSDDVINKLTLNQHMIFNKTRKLHFSLVLDLVSWSWTFFSSRVSSFKRSKKLSNWFRQFFSSIKSVIITQSTKVIIHNFKSSFWLRFGSFLFVALSEIDLLVKDLFEMRWDCFVRACYWVTKCLWESWFGTWQWVVCYKEATIVLASDSCTSFVSVPSKSFSIQTIKSDRQTKRKRDAEFQQK